MAEFDSDRMWPDWSASPTSLPERGAPFRVWADPDGEDDDWWWDEPSVPLPGPTPVPPDPPVPPASPVGPGIQPPPPVSWVPPRPAPDWTAPAHAAIRPHSGRKYVALAAALILVAAVVVGRQYAKADKTAGIAGGAGAGGAATTTPTTAPFPAAWDARVAPIAAFVEQQRHLTYKHPVRVDFLADGVFQQQYAKKIQRPRAEADQQAAIYRLEGLIGPAFDLYQQEPTMLASAVFGVYDPDTKRVIVRGDQLTPIVRVVLAHELTHVLQDQYFDLTRDFTRSGQQHGYRTAVEADAVSVEAAYEATLPADERASADSAKATGSLTPAEMKAFPPALFDFESFPYAIGPSFLDAVRAARGQAGVDEAIAHPPTQDAQLLQPERYLNPPPIVTVVPPGVGAGERLVQTADLGEFGLLELLASHGPFAPAWFALEAYSDDAGIAYTTGDATVCQRIVVSFTSPAGTTPFVTAAAAWAKAVPGAKVTRTGSMVQLEACDPGAAAPPQPTVSVLTRVEFRADGLQGLQSAVAKKVITAAKADCIATRTAGALTEAQIDLLDTNPPKSKAGFVNGLVDAAVRACR